MRPGESKNKWNSKTFTVIGTSRINANDTHLLNTRRIPTKISKIATTGRTYPVLLRVSINNDASSSKVGVGKKLK
jgi:hypothetical protein